MHISKFVSGLCLLCLSGAASAGVAGFCNANPITITITDNATASL